MSATMSSMLCMLSLIYTTQLQDLEIRKLKIRKFGCLTQYRITISSRINIMPERSGSSTAFGFQNSLRSPNTLRTVLIYIPDVSFLRIV